ncbi:hypothetical protein HMPREF3021_07405 [Staphylococcus sp. HMSC070A02]|uniref:hypothetical protein n=1 Tax=Staphylococcus TaxID=1279 RepID=UPI0007642455|nr:MULTISPECIES: hypothetical protein [Staphylococcus]OHR08069.1 hypothetical protein HMPREF2721_09875 [Staphylococcus sp. HMSC078A12]OHR56736.1 hypothetical protein HMPREF3021_07405 [Staphylococcus sp. HMSC070A02]OFN19685.1 hypothetical protein HMPREF2603_08795 [Staphylococcus sp. HMSC055C03]OHR54501.1 hypothetical protein HMPREF2798_06305 [Staphylococcus sp. HMSC070A03]SQE74887.1 Uncharacterised protein [Staphylococcus simulans]
MVMLTKENIIEILGCSPVYAQYHIDKANGDPYKLKKQIDREQMKRAYTPGVRQIEVSYGNRN